MSDDDLEAARETVRSVEAEYQLVTRDHALRRFVVEFLREERAALRDGDRDEPVCACNLPECVVKLGRIPGPIRHADDFRAGVERYLIDHPEATVLREALDAFAEKRATVRDALWEASDHVEEGL